MAQYEAKSLDHDRGSRDLSKFLFEAPDDETAARITVALVLGVLPYDATRDPHIVALLDQAMVNEDPAMLELSDENEYVWDRSETILSLTNLETGEVVYETEEDWDDEDFDDDESDFDDEEDED